MVVYTYRGWCNTEECYFFSESLLTACPNSEEHEIDVEKTSIVETKEIPDS